MKIEHLSLIFTDADDEHQGVGLESRSLADEDGTAILFVDRPFGRNGHVQGVRYFAAMPESFMLGVWRPTAVQTTYALIGRSYITSTGQGVSRSNPLWPSGLVHQTQLRVQQGVGSNPSLTLLSLRNTTYYKLYKV